MPAVGVEVENLVFRPRGGQAWHFNFRWKGQTYRFSLDRHLNKHVETKTHAEKEADQIRSAIKADGQPFGPDCYVFGDETGKRTRSIKSRWLRALLRSHDIKPTWHKRGMDTAAWQALNKVDLEFRDLRREAGSRWLEGGVPIQVVRDWLGHTNVKQTSTYLASTTHTQEDAMRRYEARLAALQGLANPSPNQGESERRSAEHTNRFPQETTVGHVEPSIH